MKANTHAAVCLIPGCSSMAGRQYVATAMTFDSARASLVEHHYIVHYLPAEQLARAATSHEDSPS